MHDLHDVDLADRMGRKRSQMFFVLAIVFFAGQSLYFTSSPLTRDSHARVGAWLILVILVMMLLFFFSSRRRHTRLQGDWSSDVCSSDLTSRCEGAPRHLHARGTPPRGRAGTREGGCCRNPGLGPLRERADRRRDRQGRSEERRVGKECRSRWSPYH